MVLGKTLFREVVSFLGGFIKAGIFHLDIEISVEFKEGNATCNSYKKDLCKLMNEDEGEEDTLRYFVNILEDSNKKTVESIDGKFRDYIKGRKTIHLWILSMGIHRQRNRFVKQIVY